MEEDQQKQIDKPEVTKDPQAEIDEIFWKATHDAAGMGEPEMTYAEYKLQTAKDALMWGLFARSTAVWVSSITLMLGGSFQTIVTFAVVTWAGGRALRWMMPDVYERNMWLGCKWLVIPISAWLLKWPLAVLAIIVAFFAGHSLDAITIMAVIFAIDITCSFLRIPL